MTPSSFECDDPPVELIVSWGKRKHLTVRRDPPGLYLNVRTMWIELRQTFQDLKRLIPAGGELPRRWTKKRVKPANPSRLVIGVAGLMSTGRIGALKGCAPGGSGGGGAEERFRPPSRC
jgi:hypothetical protein